jgi:hypothetical protein
MKEVFLLKVGRHELLEFGTGVAVLKDGDFFKIKSFIQTKGQSKVAMLHSHPTGFDRLSEADFHTLTGLRLGLGFDFVAGIVLPKSFLLFDVKLISKSVWIFQQNKRRSFVSVMKLGLSSSIKKIRQLSQYEQ